MRQAGILARHGDRQIVDQGDRTGTSRLILSITNATSGFSGCHGLKNSLMGPDTAILPPPFGQPPFPLPQIGPSGHSPCWVKKQIPGISPTPIMLPLWRTWRPGGEIFRVCELRQFPPVPHSLTGPSEYLRVGRKSNIEHSTSK